MSSSKNQSLNAYLASVNQDVADNFRGLRSAAQKSGPLESEALELIVLSSFATAGMELAFKGHARRACEKGLDKAKVRHAVLALFGASLPMASVVEAMYWLDEVCPD
jgi:alkylhydroperoxidase/carboxymuconolactone decarboxylase family protein YurZ